MTLAEGQKTRTRILQVAEELFAEHGFDGTGVDLIARKATVNKALIYYYFKDKNDILLALMKKVLEELEVNLQATEQEGLSVRQQIKQELDFLESKRSILTVLLMESLKANDKQHVDFQVCRTFHSE